jgi:PAS domain S-box-containing protein
MTNMSQSSNDTKMKESSEASRLEAEERFRVLLQSIEDGYYEVDLAGNFIFFNDSMQQILGYSGEEMMGMNNRQYSDKEYSGKLFAAFNKVYKTGEPSKAFDWQIIRKDGSKRYIEASVSLLKDASNQTVGFRGVVRDITEHRQIEEKLRNEEQRFRALAEQTSDIILMVNSQGLITYENSAVGVLGIGAENRIGQDVFERLHQDDLPKVIESFKKLFHKKNAPVQKAEIRIRNADGSWHTFEAMASNLLRDNMIEAAIVNLRDITERKRAEEKLQETLVNLRKAVSTTIQVMISAVEMRDPYTAGHQSRAANIARAIATEMELSCEIIDAIRMAGTIHDIGKLSIPSEILTKPSKLTLIEYSIVKEHSHSGYEVMKNVDSELPLAEIIYQHHERMNGSGYPRSLKGDEIILEARILAVADVVEAMSSHRPYRASLGIEKALEEIEQNKGILYDEAVVNACLRLFREKNMHLL